MLTNRAQSLNMRCITYNIAHPGGVSGHIIQATVNGTPTVGYCINIDPSPTATGFTAYVRTLAGVLTDLAFFFTVF